VNEEGGFPEPTRGFPENPLNYTGWDWNSSEVHFTTNPAGLAVHEQEHK